MSPRTALAAGTLVAGVVLAMAVGWQFLWPGGPPGERVIDLGSPSRFAPGSVTTFVIGEDPFSVAAVPPRREVEIWANKVDGCPPENVIGTTVHLVLLADGSFLALSARGTHFGEFVPWVPDYERFGRAGWFVEPCHLDTYDLDGTRVFGPASRNLDRYDVVVAGGRVTVDLRTLTRGESRSGPSRSGGTTYGLPRDGTTATPAGTASGP